ncbi:hypothetical protein DFR29_13314 [Tahibacter aquaticus]|uniref:Uncharacterized protein n=1 Tax=Tahibacter aquaticus TaxID=520092 RepID=A0A4R6YGT3_9GAMM|nr:hypothetical protein DFR29_13314 [Tahibacter aquaticus]
MLVFLPRRCARRHRASDEFDFRRDGERAGDSSRRARFDEEAAGSGRVSRANFSDFRIAADCSGRLVLAPLVPMNPAHQP